MENLTVITVPVIVSVVYALIGVITKATNESEKFKRFIPLLALIFGSILGGVLFVFEPSLIGANNAVVAILIGAAVVWLQRVLIKFLNNWAKERILKIKMTKTKVSECVWNRIAMKSFIV